MPVMITVASMLASSAPIRIVSGDRDSDAGSIVTYTGTRSLRAIRMAIKRERAGGDRWAWAMVYAHPCEDGTHCGYVIDDAAGELVDTRVWHPPYPDAARQRASRQRGRPIGITLRDPAAIAALDALRETHGLRGALEHALRVAAP